MRRPAVSLPSAREVESALRKAAPFDRLAPERLAALAARALPVRCRAREVLFIEGAPAESAWVLYSGRVNITCSSSRGRKRILETILPGELFGTLCRVFSHGAAYPCSAEASTDGVCLRLPWRDFTAALHGNAALLEQLCVLCSHRLNDMHALPRLAMEPPRVRLAFVLSRLARVYGPRIPVKEREVAEAAGLAIETAYRAFHELRSERLVATRAHGIIALDPPGLRDVWQDAGPVRRPGAPGVRPAPAPARAA